MRGSTLGRLSTLALAVLLAACSDAASTPERAELTIGTGPDEVTLTVEVADTADERETGLMNRESLGEESGMAFVWDEPIDAQFWMKDTLIPLSVAFWDEQGRILGIRDMDPCEADPCPTYGSPEPYVGAVEVDQGWFAEHGVEIGDEVVLYRHEA